MLVEEGGANRLLTLSSVEGVDDNVFKLVSNVLSIIDAEVGTAWHYPRIECE